jgi:hypothetical protein
VVGKLGALSIINGADQPSQVGAAVVLGLVVAAALLKILQSPMVPVAVVGLINPPLLAPIEGKTDLFVVTSIIMAK